MRKLTAKWVPCLLTIHQKRQRVRDLKSCLDPFNLNPNNFLRRLVTTNETWIYHYTPESKQQVKQWIGPGGTAPKRTDTTIGWKLYSSCFLRFQWHILYRLFGKRKNNEQRLLLCIIGPVKRRNHKKTASFVEGKVPLSTRQCNISQIDKNDVKNQSITLAE